MTPTPDTIAGIETHCERALMAALPRDLRGRLLVLRLPEHETAWGLACGSGGIAAVAHGGTSLDRAIRLNAAAIITYYDSLDEAQCAALAIVAHEVAHILVSVPDPATTHAEAVAIWREVLVTPSVGGADRHCPRWAGAFFVIADRLKSVLPAVEHRAVIRLVWSGLRAHGFAPLVLLDVLAGRSMPESVAAAFAPDTAASLALMGACDSDEARQSWIDRTYQHTSASVADAA